MSFAAELERALPTLVMHVKEEPNMVADAFKRIVRFVDAASGAVPTPADELFVLLHALHGGVGKPCPSLLESDAPLRSPAEEQVLKLEYVLLAIEVREKNNTRLPFLVRREGQVIEAELALLAIKERRVACCATRNAASSTASGSPSRANSKPSNGCIARPPGDMPMGVCAARLLAADGSRGGVAAG